MSPSSSTRIDGIPPSSQLPRGSRGDTMLSVAKKTAAPRRSSLFGEDNAAGTKPAKAGKAGSPDDANPGGVRSAAPFVPKTASVRTLSAAANACLGCDLYKTATQV